MRHRAGRTLACALGVVVAVPALYSGRALAETGHQFVASLSEASPGTKLVEPGSLAVDHATGQVFVGDLLAGDVDVYSSAGAYETQFGGGELEAVGIAVDEADGDVYVAEPFEDAVRVYEPDREGGYRLLGLWSGSGTPGGEFGEVTGVAIDNSSGPHAGDLYVVESQAVGSEGGAIDLFRPKPNPAQPEEVEEGAGEEGEFLGRLSGPRLEEPNGVAVDGANGRVLVADSVKGLVYAYTPEGVYEEKLNGKGSPHGSFRGREAEEGNVAGIAVDESSGDVYVAEAERHVVSQYGASGEWIGWITSGQDLPLDEPRGVALGAAGDVYVADATAALVDHFGAGVTFPDATTGKVSKAALTRTSAVVSGTVDGDGTAAGYRFQYGESEALGSETTTRAAGASETAASAVLEGLRAGTTYYFRVVAENENGVNSGLIREFSTPPAVEDVATGAVENVQPESATLTGKLTPGGVDAHYYFQWGTSATYGNTSPAEPIDAGDGAHPVSAEDDLSGLSPNTVYHYRIVAENSFGTTYGADEKLTTSGPPRTTSEPATGIGHEQATLQARVDPDQLATTYRFQYGETTAYGSEAPLGGAGIGAGAEPVAVSAALSNLKLGVTYHFRVLAENSAGTVAGPDQSFTTVPPAPVDATYAIGVSTDEATLHAQIDPLGNDTHYYFQYGTQSCSERPSSCTDLPSPPEDIGSGDEDVARNLTLTGLTAHTVYHYRVLAGNSLGTTEGPEHTFTTSEQEAPLILPDGRAWEMVSPPDKRGAPVEALTREGGVILAAEDGDALTYVVDGALGEEVQGNRSPEWQQVIATRGASEWSSRDISTPTSRPTGVTAGQAPEYQFFTPDLSLALVEPPGLAAEPPLAPGVTQATMYLRENASETYLPLVTEANVSAGTHFGGEVHLLSATPDLSHVVIDSEVALTGAGSAPGLYEWSAGQLRFVSVLPDGVAARAAELGFFDRVLTDAISEDGARIVWTNKEDLSTRGGHLYMADTRTGETLQLDAAAGVAEPSKGSAQFQGANSDDSRVFFTDRQRLTPDSTAEPGGSAPKADLYECEVVEVAGKLKCDLQDLTVALGEDAHAAVQGLILGSSDDGTSVYLLAQGVLATNENANAETAEAGRENLYELHFDETQWTTTFIATLASEDSPEWEGNDLGDRAFVTARVSPNGRYLAFMSAAPLTGYDNVDASPQADGARDEEVYLYDSASASLRCVSCSPSGGLPDGVLDANESGEGLGLLVDRSKVWIGHWLAGNIPGWTAQSLTSALVQSRYLSNEGRLYFDSPDDLVPAATNGREDVYEYEPSGVGSCQSATGGCVSLISGGGSDRESAFLEATPTGSDVFFVTEAQLLPQDTDTAFDIYDARECTQSSPCLSPPPGQEVACAETQACRPAEPAKQIPGGPAGSATASGPGNAGASPVTPAKHGVNAKKAVKPLTRAQKLARALESCHKRYPHTKRKRRACMRAARKRYDPPRKTRSGKAVR